MVNSKTAFPHVPRLRLHDGNIDWPAVALRNTESAAQVMDIHQQSFFEPGYQARLQEHAHYLSSQGEAAWDHFFTQLPTTPHSSLECSQMYRHFMAHAHRIRTLTTCGALSEPAAQRLMTRAQRWQSRVMAALVPSTPSDRSAPSQQASSPSSDAQSDGACETSLDSGSTSGDPSWAQSSDHQE